MAMAKMLLVLPEKPSVTVCTPFACHIFIERLLSGKDNDFDVILIDTAGRMQDNEV